MIDLSTLLGTYNYDLGYLDVEYIFRGALLLIFVWVVALAFINVLKGVLK